MKTHEPFETASRENLDAAQRMCDTVNNLGTHKTYEELVNGWIAFRLSDGTWDGTLYDSRGEAVRHVSNPDHFFFLSTRSAPGGMSLRDAHTTLAFQRAAVDAGLKLADPDHANGGKELIPPVTRNDFRSQTRRLIIASGKSTDYYRSRR